MGKIMVLCAVFASLVLSSCSKTEDNYIIVPENSASDITGKWYITQVDTVLDNVEVFTPYTGNEPGCERDNIVFNSDFSIKTTEFNSLNTPCEEHFVMGNFALSGNILILNFYDEDPLVITVLSHSPTVLKLRYPNGIIYVWER